MSRALKILICDDSLVIRRKLSESIKLCHSNVHIVEAADSFGAERMFILHKPDLIFMDIILPDRNGIDTVKRLKEIDPNAKIIMISTAGTKANLFKSVSAGAFDFIQKPIDHSTIEKVIYSFISRMQYLEEGQASTKDGTKVEEEEEDELL